MTDPYTMEHPEQNGLQPLKWSAHTQSDFNLRLESLVSYIASSVWGCLVYLATGLQYYLRSGRLVFMYFESSKI